MVLDTNVVIYLLEGRLAEPLDATRICASVITEIELLSHPNLDAKSESAIRAFLSEIEIIGLAEPIKEECITLRRRHGLTIPDAVIAATAITLDTQLLSNDAKLAAKLGTRCQTVSL